MNHEKDRLEEVLKDSIETEEALMRTYLISAERVQDDDELKERLETTENINFSVVSKRPVVSYYGYIYICEKN